MPRNPEWELHKINAKTRVHCILCRRTLRQSYADKQIKMFLRQRLVLDGIIAGKTNPEIAQETRIPLRTVKKYVHQLFVEYGVDTKRYLGRVRLVYLENRRRQVQAAKKEK